MGLYDFYKGQPPFPPGGSWEKATRRPPKLSSTVCSNQSMPWFIQYKRKTQLKMLDTYHLRDPVESFKSVTV